LEEEEINSKEKSARESESDRKLMWMGGMRKKSGK
jgi:hypothetical protein